MANTLDNIDDAIAYLESPEYLRMIARNQGESANQVLSSNPAAYWADELAMQDPTPPVPAPAPSAEREHNTFGIQWDRRTGRCECQSCTERRTPPVPLRTSYAQLAVRKSSVSDFADVLSDKRPFNTRGALAGRVDSPAIAGGRLREKSPAAYALWQVDQNMIDYVVYSYRTPIAWHVTTPNGAAEWVVPRVKYSRITSAHQNKIEAALSSRSANVRFISDN